MSSVAIVEKSLQNSGKLLVTAWNSVAWKINQEDKNQDGLRYTSCFSHLPVLFFNDPFKSKLLQTIYCQNTPSDV